MPLNIVRQDITKMNTDAIVDASGHNLAAHGWVGTAIAKAAGPEYQRACEAIGYCDTGDAKITEGYNLPAKYVIHTVGPRYEDGHVGEGLLLKSCYEKSLALAKEHDCNSIAFPLIATGGYGFPKEEGLKIATDTLQEYLKQDDDSMDIYLVIFDSDTTLLSRELDLEIEEYIDDNYEGADGGDFRIGTTYRQSYNRRRITHEQLIQGGLGNNCLPEEEEHPEEIVFKQSLAPKSAVPRKAASLESALKVKDESFKAMLFRLIEEKGLKNSEVYNKANLSKSHFSKMKNSIDYNPKKETVFALAVALELDIDETKEMMMKAGYAISHSFMLDTIVEYFIVNKKYNIVEINIALFDYDQPLLGEKAL